MYGLLLSVITVYFSAFEYSGSGVTRMFPYTIAAVDPSVPGIYMNPSLLAKGDGLTLSTYGCRPYSENGLHSYNSGMRYSENNRGAQFSWKSFGADFYTENTFTAGAGLAPCEYIRTGIAASIFLLSIDTGEERYTESMKDFDLSLAIEPFRWLELSCLQTNSSLLFSDKNSGSLYHEWSAGALFKPFTGFSCGYNITGTDAEKVNTFIAAVVPAKFLYISGGYSTGCSQFAASAALMFNRFNLSYSLSYHPYLGCTHTFGASFTTQVLPAHLEYGAVFSDDKVKKININKASDEEIRNLPGLCEKSCKRVIVYREKIGVLTEKSLVQLGLSGDEIESVRMNTYGLARNSKSGEDKDDNNEFYGKKRRNSGRKYLPPKERIKQRFRILIKAGIAANSAIRYSEMFESAENEEIEQAVDADRTLTKEQRQAVLGLCTE